MEYVFKPKAWRVICPKCRGVMDSHDGHACSNCDSPMDVVVKGHSFSKGPDHYYGMVLQCTNGLCNMSTDMASNCDSCGASYSKNSYQWLGPRFILGCALIFAVALGYAAFFVCSLFLGFDVGGDDPDKSLVTIGLGIGIFAGVVFLFWSRQKKKWRQAYGSAY